MPWNGLIVIGKRIELQGRNTAKPRMGDPKHESEYWRPEGVGKLVLKEKSEVSQEEMDGKGLRSPASPSQVSADLGKEGPGEGEEKQEAKGKTGTEASAETIAESRREFMSEERPEMTVETRRGSASEERLGPTVLKEQSEFGQEEIDEKGPHSVASASQASADTGRDSPRETEEKQEVRKETGAESGAEVIEESRRASVSEERSEVTAGSSRGSVSEERLEVIEESASEKRPEVTPESRRGSASEERLEVTPESRRESGERLGSMEDKVGTSGEDMRSRGDQLGQDELRSSGESLEYKKEKQKSTGEKRAPIRERRVEEQGSSGENLEDGPRMENVSEEDIEKLQEATSDEKVIEVTNEEMEIPFESMGERDEKLEEIEEKEVDEDNLRETEDITGESVSMGEKDVIEEIDEEPSE
ncbi:hypothetical protein H920_10258 [Fukomys damarensis]|uniref:Uncharacterized protein n=1 Tax=Fukomys damarensis TaxID=885580 RepID=A0A091DBE3_FUKDA|nr:hypothetical protein H920_10258 [Fukomys damarensis]